MIKKLNSLMTDLKRGVDMTAIFEFDLATGRSEMIDITSRVRQAVKESGIQQGICLVYSPHTTAAITLNENADPNVVKDIQFALGAVFSDRPEFRHAEGNSAAHLRSSVIGASETIPVKDGELLLGTWQAVYFCEFDGPRSRRFTVAVMG